MYRDRAWRLHHNNRVINKWLDIAKREYISNYIIDHWTGEIKEWYKGYREKFWCPGRLVKTGHSKWDMGYDPWDYLEERYRYTRCRQERKALDNALRAWYYGDEEWQL